MSVQSCRVSVQDLMGVTHTVEVTAESVFEAVALFAPGDGRKHSEHAH